MLSNMWITKNIVAVILGGGAGTRLFPLTSSRSKPAVPLAGKYRLVDIPISNCINSNINRIFVLTQYNSASLNKHIKNTYQFSAFSSGFTDILAAEQTPESTQWFQGTADAVRKSLKHLNNLQFDDVLILSGDQLYQMDFESMYRIHEKENADITIATIPVKAEEATSFGILKSDENNQITSFIEKPDASLLPDWLSETGQEMKAVGRGYLASMGIYLFKKKVLYDLLENIYPEATDFGKEIIPQSIENHKVYSYQYGGYWTDIGSIPSFFKANLALAQELPPFNLFDNNNRVYSRARMLPPAKISETKLKHVIVSDGCIIHASELEECIIGIRSRIGKGSVLKRCYMMGEDFYETIEDMADAKAQGLPYMGVGGECYIENAIIDKNCRIGNNVYIKGGDHLEDTDSELYTIKNGIVVIKKFSVLPDGFRIE